MAGDVDLIVHSLKGGFIAHASGYYRSCY
jgi:hypothetical protein